MSPTEFISANFPNSGMKIEYGSKYSGDNKTCFMKLLLKKGIIWITGMT